MQPFTYTAPDSLDDALQRMNATTRPLAGGTDLIPLMQAGLAAPGELLSISRLLPRTIEPQPGHLRLGAGACLADVAQDPHVRQRYAALAQAAEQAASAPLRNMATLGGNLLQRPRCWYFRQADFHCWLKGGETCFARDGENQRHALFDQSPCSAVHPSDLAPALLAFDASLSVRGPQGEHAVSLADFFALPQEANRRENCLDEQELIVSIDLPAHPDETRSVYLKAMDRGAFSFALVSVAAVLRLSDKHRIAHARLVLGGVSPIPWPSPAAERHLLGKPVSDALLTEAAQLALQDAAPRQHNGWKVPLAKALVERALQILCRT